MTVGTTIRESDEQPCHELVRPGIACANLSFDEALQFTGYGSTYLWELVHSDRIPHKHVGKKGGKVVFNRRALDDWMYADAMSHVREDER